MISMSAMRLRYFILCLMTLTCISLVYTWQQTEIIKLAYLENNKNKVCKELLDRNQYLRYNLSIQKSALSLGNKFLDGAANFELPQPSQMMTLLLPIDNPQGYLQEGFRPGQKAGIKLKRQETFIMSIAKLQNALPLLMVKSFINKQAQAQDFNKR